jgi:Immunoglobulin-like domain of bacterial spore germination
MKSFSLWHDKRLFIGISLLIFMAFVLGACSGIGGGNGGSGTPTAGSNPTTTRGGNGSTATVTPVVRLGAQPCPDAVKDPAHWTSIIAPTSGAKVESVSCANLRGVPALQAVVTVRYDGSGAILDLYVYDHTGDPSPVQLFKLQNLTKGDAKISGYNTLMTAEVDANSGINAGKPNAGLTQDLFREFKWSDGAGTLVPVAFPGIFPDLTRYQAEADQAQVNQGHQPWKLSATMTAQALGASQDLLKWNPNAPATIVSGGGQHDINAVVRVKSTDQVSGMITVTMSRLEQNSNGGIWEATSVTSGGMSITVPHDRDRLGSPVTVKGTGNAFEGKIGRVIVLDHLYKNIGQGDANGASGNGSTTFSSSVTYNSTFKSGIQEGVVVLYSYSNANGSIAGAVMVKEMLG